MRISLWSVCKSLDGLDHHRRVDCSNAPPVRNMRTEQSCLIVVFSEDKTSDNAGFFSTQYTSKYSEFPPFRAKCQARKL